MNFDGMKTRYSCVLIETQKTGVLDGFVCMV